MREIVLDNLEPSQVIAPRPLVLFSGGLDSTYLLWDLMVNQKTDVDVLYAEGHQSNLKKVKEKEARQRIIAKLQELSGRAVIGRYEVPEISPSGNQFRPGYDSVTSIHHVQSFAWFMSAIYVVNPKIHSNVQIGYVMCDSIIAYLFYMQEAWNNLRAFSCNDKVELIFPISGKTKEGLIDALPKELLEMVWVCETPLLKDGEIVSCNKCRPCRRHAMELEYRHHGDSQLLRESARHHEAYMQGLKNVENYSEESDKVILLKQPSKRRPRRYTIRGGIRCTTTSFCAHRPYR